jgi:hypothetical protein
MQRLQSPFQVYFNDDRFRVALVQFILHRVRFRLKHTHNTILDGTSDIYNYFAAKETYRLPAKNLSLLHALDLPV